MKYLIGILILFAIVVFALPMRKKETSTESESENDYLVPEAKTFTDPRLQNAYDKIRNAVINGSEIDVNGVLADARNVIKNIIEQLGKTATEGASSLARNQITRAISDSDIWPTTGMQIPEDSLYIQPKPNGMGEFVTGKKPVEDGQAQRLDKTLMMQIPLVYHVPDEGMRITSGDVVPFEDSYAEQIIKQYAQAKKTQQEQQLQEELARLEREGGDTNTDNSTKSDYHFETNMN